MLGVGGPVAGGAVLAELAGGPVGVGRRRRRLGEVGGEGVWRRGGGRGGGEGQRGGGGGRGQQAGGHGRVL